MSDTMSETTSWSTSTSLTAGAVTAVSQQAVQGGTGCCVGEAGGAVYGGQAGAVQGGQGEQGVAVQGAQADAMHIGVALDSCKDMIAATSQPASTHLRVIIKPAFMAATADVLAGTS